MNKIRNTLTPVRYYTDKDPYFYTVDNRPLEDLDANTGKLAEGIDVAINSSLVSSLGLSFSNRQLFGNTLTYYTEGFSYPGGLTLNVLPGFVLSPQPISLADSRIIMKQGISIDPSSFTFSSPASAGNVKVYTIEASYQEPGLTTGALPFFDSSNAISNDSVLTGLAILVLNEAEESPESAPVSPARDPYTALVAKITIGYGQTKIVPDNVITYASFDTKVVTAATIPYSGSTNITSRYVGDALTELDHTKAGLALKNTFTDTQSMPMVELGDVNLSLEGLNQEVYLRNLLGGVNVPALTSCVLSPNATWDGINWNRIDETSPATLIEFVREGFISFKTVEPGPNPIAWTGNYTLWNSGNDGSGSGLDADTLDGLDSTVFARSVVDNDFTVPQTVASGTASGHAVNLSQLDQVQTRLSDHETSSTAHAASAIVTTDGNVQGDLDGKVNTSDYTGSTILAKLAPVDGSGSGLDADTVDGVQASNLAKLDASNTFTLQQTIPDGTVANHAASKGQVDTVQSNLDTHISNPAGAHSAVAISFTPGGNLSSSTVQAAISELDSEKLPAASYTAADVLAKIMTVDGAGSGLDADLFDGLDSTSFVQLDTDGTLELPRYNEGISVNSASSTAAVLDLGVSNIFDLTLTDNCTISFSNVPASGRAANVTLYLHQDSTGGRSVTLPTGIKWAYASPPTLSTSASATDILTFSTLDGGVTWYGFVSGIGMG